MPLRLREFVAESYRSFVGVWRHSPRLHPHASRRAPAPCSCRPPHGLNEGGNFSRVLDAFTLLHSARHIHGIRAHPADSLADVLRSQSARENQGLAQIMWHAVPVEYLAGTSGRVRDIGIEQQPGGVTIETCHLVQIDVGFHVDSLDVRAVIAAALFRLFVAVKLYQVERYVAQDA